MPRSKAGKRHTESRASPVSPIPPGYPPLIPYLAVNGGAAALEFYKKAFGAKELARQSTPDGKLIHGRLKIGTSILMLSDVFPGSGVASPAAVGTTTVTLHLYAKNVDAMWDRAIAAGAKVTMPLENQYWGERYGHLLDPFGHHWSLSMRVRM
ncbi:MAG: VOC family protein, partial [Thermoplasmata archaeon]